MSSRTAVKTEQGDCLCCGQSCGHSVHTNDAGKPLDVAKLVADHDKLMKCLTAVLMQIGVPVKIHAVQLEAAGLCSLDFKVDQPFLEIRVKPPQTEGAPRIQVAGSLSGLPPPPGTKS